jgi:hypothetical protein
MQKLLTALNRIVTSGYWPASDYAIQKIALDEDRSWKLEITLHALHECGSVGAVHYAVIE